MDNQTKQDLVLYARDLKNKVLYHNEDSKLDKIRQKDSQPIYCKELSDIISEYNEISDMPQTAGISPLSLRDMIPRFPRIRKAGYSLLGVLRLKGFRHVGAVANASYRKKQIELLEEGIKKNAQAYSALNQSCVALEKELAKIEGIFVGLEKLEDRLYTGISEKKHLLESPIDFNAKFSRFADIIPNIVEEARKAIFGCNYDVEIVIALHNLGVIENFRNQLEDAKIDYTHALLRVNETMEPFMEANKQIKSVLRRAKIEGNVDINFILSYGQTQKQLAEAKDLTEGLDNVRNDAIRIAIELGVNVEDLKRRNIDTETKRAYIDISSERKLLEGKSDE
ncbi:hypothetical protein J4468_04135 [Candidatus Woesearchaeota archaeon]|nr:hypothetical protein [Candidatus Woesearchaeota archaeon]